MSQDHDQSADQVQNMTLYDDYQSGIQDGSYRFVVQQSVTFGDEAHHYYRDQRFVVVGPRFALAPDDIHARYPPPNGSGDYKTTLPHIVLRKRALPWERPGWRMDGKAGRAPWLALLVLSQGELNTAAADAGQKSGGAGQADGEQSASVQASPLQPPVTPKQMVSNKAHKEGITLLPELDDEGDGDDGKTLVQVLDLTLDVFRKVCPASEDLPYLAHMRSVDPGDKVPLNMHATGEFSVLVANRFPQPGSNVAFLVSLEGWGSLFLPDGDPDKRVSDDADRVRLVVLDSWTFNDDEAGIHTFGELMEGLDVQPIGAAGGTANGDAGAMLKRGYVPVEYRAWRSTPTIGWYRGPLAPTPVTKASPKPGSAFRLFHKADAALVFDADTGMFDLSYAAAWQLGQLTALSSPHFAQDLRRFIDQTHDAFDAVRETNDFVKNHIGAMDRAALPEQQGFLETGESGDEETEQQESGGTGDEETGTQELDATEQAEGQAPVTGSAAQQSPTQVRAADSLVHFLARLALLYPVPYEYLVAHASLLPRESMRVFFVDNNWIDALFEGALSIALDCARDGQVSQATREDLYSNISQVVYRYRRQQQGLQHRQASTEPPANYMADFKTGFLLRSAAISGWPGTEVICYDGHGARAQVLRMDHLGKDLLFCLASGEIKQVVIKEPGEGLRFGLDTDQKVMLRHWQKADGPPGAPIKLKAQERWLRINGQEINFKSHFQRAGKANGVLNISAIALALREQVTCLEDAGCAAALAKLEADPGDPAKAAAPKEQMERLRSSSDDTFRSAAFALQMMRSPEQETFDIAYAAASVTKQEG